MNNYFLVCISVLLIFSSCAQKTFDTKDELMAYVTNPENGYVHTKSVNGVDFTITYRPTDILVKQEMGGNDPELLDELRNKYHDYIYFNLSISKNKQEILSDVASSGNDFGSMVNQLAFGMGDKVHLFSKTRDTVEMADYIYPRLFGMSNTTAVLFVYPRHQKMLQHEYFHFTIEDIGLSTGEVSFKIPTKSILNEPNLIF